MFLVVGIVMTQCKKKDSAASETPSTPSNPEEGVTIEMTEGGGGIEILGTVLQIDEDGCFVVANRGKSAIVDIGPVASLKYVDTVPGPDGIWTDRTEVLEGHGYVVVDTTGNADRPTQHSKLYVKKKNRPKATVKVKNPWNPLPVVTTGELSNTLFGQYVRCSGKVVSEGAAPVTVRGIMFGAGHPDPNPLHAISSAPSGSGLGEYVSQCSHLYGGGSLLTARAYAKNRYGVAYGDFKTHVYGSPDGAIAGDFSVAYGRRVLFSQGNLQYQASTRTWRFAEKQWDYVGSEVVQGGDPSGTVPGSSNHLISDTYDGWIDMFGWGTGDNPTKTSTEYSDYLVFTDWGTNAISNGGGQSNVWRTLTKDEWDYLLNTRATMSGMRYAKAIVNGINGVVLFPDDWSVTTYNINNYNDSDADFSANIISDTDWCSILELNGAVFMPSAGHRTGTEVYAVNPYTIGYYWTSDRDSSSAYALCTVSWIYESLIRGIAVRLVYDVQY